MSPNTNSRQETHSPICPCTHNNVLHNTTVALYEPGDFGPKPIGQFDSLETPQVCWFVMVVKIVTAMTAKEVAGDSSHGHMYLDES